MKKKQRRLTLEQFERIDRDSPYKVLDTLSHKRQEQRMLDGDAWMGRLYCKLAANALESKNGVSEQLAASLVRILRKIEHGVKADRLFGQHGSITQADKIDRDMVLVLFELGLRHAGRQNPSGDIVHYLSQLAALPKSALQTNAWGAIADNPARSSALRCLRAFIDDPPNEEDIRKLIRNRKKALS